MSKGIVYPSKILLAWGEAIGGNRKIREWLVKNGYPELGIFVFALRNFDDARQWLMENGFPHLMALINGIEGNKEALIWLDTNGFRKLGLMALAADGNEEAKTYLAKNDRLFSLLARRMEDVKAEIDRDNNDVHKISPV